MGQDNNDLLFLEQDWFTENNEDVDFTDRKLKGKKSKKIAKLKDKKLK